MSGSRGALRPKYTAKNSHILKGGFALMALPLSVIGREQPLGIVAFACV